MDSAFKMKMVISQEAATKKQNDWIAFYRGTIQMNIF